MITSGQVYTQVLNKTMEDAQRKANSHIETINLREVLPARNFMFRLDERYYGKFQKLCMPYSHIVVAGKHAHHEYRNYIHFLHTLESVSNVYKGLFGELHNKTY
ncbi:hypothetical protein GmHk_07G019327 [Glycine max]|nr:hypothetical protein GmHk_07G019327 [Glycine max]